MNLRQRRAVQAAPAQGRPVPQLRTLDATLDLSAVPREQVAAGLLSWLFEAAERRYGMARAALLHAAALEADDVSDPQALLPVEALISVFRFLIAGTRDPGLGLSLADALDLRTQGFWGYAMLCCATLRERLELQVRYQRLRSPLSLSFWEAGPIAVLEIEPSGLPPDVSPFLLDWSFALELQQLHSHLQPRRPEAELWLTCAERPHHAELRALLAGSIVFRAPCNRLQFPASALEVRLAGDPHLGKLAIAQLDKQLKAQAQEKPSSSGGVLAQVQSRLRVQFARDPSLTSVSRELGMSARTLQRQLDRHGASFHQLLEEVRCAHAIDYLLGSAEAVERIAAYVGYRDPSNFRRAFRRWTGVSPAAFRAERRSSSPDSRPSSAGHG